MKKALILILSIAFIFQGCNDKKNSKGELHGFSGGVLENWMENIIIPSYKNYQEKAVNLTTKAKSFEEDATEANLSALKEAWLESYKAYQKTILFNFDAAKNYYYLGMSNTFPTESSLIEENITKIENGNDVHLKTTLVSTRYTYQGFPALDYLLFSEGKDLAYYKSNKPARTYMRMLTETLQMSIDKVVAYWNENKNNYINNTDQSVSGAYSATINAFIEVYEQQIRAQKVGYACGAIPNQKGEAIPNFIEAYYKGDISKELLKISLQSSQDFFNGKYYNGKGSGKSLSQILEEIGHKALVNKINGQYDVIYKRIDETSKTLKELAKEGMSQSDFTKRPLFGLYSDIQTNVGNFKTRMLNALNVQVGYQDSDGD